MAKLHQYYSDWEQYNGRKVKVDGIECEIKVDIYTRKYPTEALMISVYAEPTARAKRTEQYKEARRKLGDDWATDVLDSDIEVQVDILTQLGVVFPNGCNA